MNSTDLSKLLKLPNYSEKESLFMTTLDAIMPPWSLQHIFNENIPKSQKLFLKESIQFNLVPLHSLNSRLVYLNSINDSTLKVVVFLDISSLKIHPSKPLAQSADEQNAASTLLIR